MKIGVVILGICFIISAVLLIVDEVPILLALLPLLFGLIGLIFFVITSRKKESKEKEKLEPEKTEEKKEDEEKKDEKKTEPKKADEKKSTKKSVMGWVFLVFALIIAIFCWHHLATFGVRKSEVLIKNQEIRQEEQREEKKEVKKGVVRDVQSLAVEIPTQSDRDWVTYAVQWRKANPGVAITQRQKAALRKARQLGMLTPEQLEVFSPEDFGD